MGLILISGSPEVQQRLPVRKRGNPRSDMEKFNLKK
jgi:hypothetical protein